MPDPEFPQPTSSQPPLLCEVPAAGLLAAARAGTLYGSLLLIGEDGVGKRRLAIEMASQLLAGQPASPEVARRVIEGLHPDVLEVGPEGGFIKVAAARKIVEEASRRPYEASRRVVIIDEAHRLHSSAANALLKTLEEPAEELVFILVSSRPEDILSTIRSRAPSHHVPPVSSERLGAWLEELGWTAEDISRALPFARGRPGFAIRGGHVQLEATRDRLLELLEGMDAPGGRLVLARALAEADPFVDAVTLLSELLRDAILVGAGASELARHSQVAELRRLPSAAAISGLARRLLDVPSRLVSNPNRKLLMTSLVLEG